MDDAASDATWLALPAISEAAREALVRAAPDLSAAPFLPPFFSPLVSLLELGLLMEFSSDFANQPDGPQ
jgi:hypothetical protein